MNAPNFTDETAQGVKIKLANHPRSLAWGHLRASFAALALIMGHIPLKGIFLPLGGRTGLSAFGPVAIKVK